MLYEMSVTDVFDFVQIFSFAMKRVEVSEFFGSNLKLPGDCLQMLTITSAVDWDMPYL